MSFSYPVKYIIIVVPVVVDANGIGDDCLLFVPCVRRPSAITTTVTMIMTTTTTTSSSSIFFFS